MNVDSTEEHIGGNDSPVNPVSILGLSSRSNQRGDNNSSILTAVSHEAEGHHVEDQQGLQSSVTSFKISYSYSFREFAANESSDIDPKQHVASASSSHFNANGDDVSPLPYVTTNCPPITDSSFDVGIGASSSTHIEEPNRDGKTLTVYIISSLVYAYFM